MLSTISSASHRPERDLLLSCARTTMRHPIAERVRALVQQEIDWEHLLRTSISHGVAPLLYRSLTGTCPEAVPDRIMRQLRDYSYANALRNLLMTQELLKILNAFEAHHITAVPFKGPLLAESVYGDVSLRQFCDLDILVPRQDVVRAKEILVSQGYSLQFPLTRRQEACYLESRHHFSLRHRDGWPFVELHWRIRARYFSSRLDAEAFWHHLEPMSLRGKEVWAFSPEDLLLILCSHASRHFWTRLEWICDVAELIGVHKELNWQRLIGRARRLGAERMLFLGLSLASDVLGAALPEEVLRTLRADSVVRSLGRRLREGMFHSHNFSPELPDMFLLYLKMAGGISYQLRYCLRCALDAMSPTRSDWELVRLPDSLFFFYYLLRPAYLAAKYGPSIWRRLAYVQGYNSPASPVGERS